jgi:hypothetical protein
MTRQGRRESFPRSMVVNKVDDLCGDPKKYSYFGELNGVNQVSM